MKNAMKILLVAVVAAALLFGGAALAAAETVPGSEEDPLITLSYINDVFSAYIQELFRTELDTRTLELETGLEERVAALEERCAEENALVERSTYQVVTLQDGEKLVCQRGTELMLRVGSAYVKAADTPGLVDTSTTENLNDGGYLIKNHMYMATINGHGIVADGYVMVVARGTYTVE